MSNERLFPSSSVIGLQLGASGQVVTELQGFLGKYGYLKETEDSNFAYSRDSTVPKAATGIFDDATEEALRNYQKFHGLPVTGELDRATVDQMRKPRCGCPDQPSNIRAKFAAPGSRWDRTDLTYRIVNFSPDLSQTEIRDGMRQAFDLWSAVTPLRFTEVAGDADILINFAPNDGAGKVLAYAYFPPIGDSSFDEDETWTVNVPTPQGRVDLVTVAAHEFGHSLGLGHSAFAEAIMFPSYSGPHRFLAQDDIDGIQFLYGKPSDRRRKSPVTNAPLGAIARKPEQQDLFLVGEDGRVYSSWWVEGVTDWTGVNDNWRSLGGVFPAGERVTVVSRKPDHLDLFVIGNDGRVYTSWWVEGVTDWTGVNDNWRSLGGVFPVGARVTAVSRKPEHLDLFVIGNDGRVYTSWWVEGVTDWTGVNDNWRPLGGFFPVGAPVGVISRKPGDLALFVVGNDGRVYSSWWVEGVIDWTGVNDNWRSLGGFFPIPYQA
jgi:peptidoglycan hydrolase-like protein with peptidoglycan-binding domain